MQTYRAHEVAKIKSSIINHNTSNNLKPDPNRNACPKHNQKPKVKPKKPGRGIGG